MWLNLRQEGRYWDAAGLGGGQAMEFSAEAGKHDNNGLAGMSSASLPAGSGIGGRIPAGRSRGYCKEDK